MANDNTSNDDQISRLKSLASLSSDSSFVMLNINRYKPEVNFPDGETYGAYMSAIEHSVGAIGGSVLWRVPVQGGVVGDLEDFDEVMAVWYPSHKAFLELPDADRAREMFRYRRVCVEKAHIVELSDESPSLRPLGS